MLITVPFKPVGSFGTGIWGLGQHRLEVLVYICMKKAVIYARVSTHQQETSRQTNELKNFAEKEQLNLVDVVEEKVSGTTTSKQRYGLSKVISMAESRDFEILLIHEVSRLGRSTLEVLKVLDRLTSLGINVYIAHFSQYTLLPNGERNPMSAFIFTMLSSLAEMERETLVSRIKSGMAEAKRQGRDIGRPKGTSETRESFLKKHQKVVRLLKEGMSIRNVATLTNTSKNTVLKVKKCSTPLKLRN